MPLVVKTVRTLEDLKQVVVDYLHFDEFVFDVETVANREIRMLPGEREIAARSQVSRLRLPHRDSTQVFTCGCCGRLFVSERKRLWCSDECQKAIGKDKPALDPLTNRVWSVSLAGPWRSDVIPCGHPLIVAEGGDPIGTASLALPESERAALVALLERYGRRHQTGAITIPEDCLVATMRFTTRTPTHGLLREATVVAVHPATR